MDGPTPTPRARWSLTSRMAWRFALTTSAIVALHALGSSYLLYDALRGELREFLQHEASELAHNVSIGGTSPEALKDAARSIAKVTEEARCAYVIHAPDGGTYTSGDTTLLDLQQPVFEVLDGADIGFALFTRRYYSHVDNSEQGYPVMVVADAEDLQDKLMAYLSWSGLVFLGATALAAISGWLTASRGLVGLRQFVAQARSIDLAGDGVRVSLANPPLELDELVREINLMLGRIEQGLGQMRTFTASLAHELRSPLQTLIGETEIALLTARPTAEYERLLRSNLEDLQELSDAVDNLVAYCRSAEPQPRAAPRESFDLAAEARIRLERELRSARRDGVDVDLTIEGDTHLFADREACLRVVRNLVGNAISWSPPGGIVDVAIRGLPDRVQLVVEDRGPGIPPDLAERIFEPFVSGRSRPGRRGGYGLGLAICRSAVAEHGGTLRHEQREGGGTRFVAEFARSRTTAAA